MSNQRDHVCPQCGASESVPIAYGLPGPELMKAAQQGEVALGGCIISDDDPARRCKSCGAEWGHIRRHR